MSISKILTGVLLGGVLGATVGWLTAPASGVEIRRSLGEKLGNTRRSLEEKIKTGEEKISRRGKEPLPIE